MWQYYKCMTDLNQHLIVPKGPVPDIEEGIKEDFAKLAPGGIKLATVENYASTLVVS
jgi:hypothetical protein